MFKNSVNLFDIFGFRIRVDPSWLLIAALIVWNLSTAYFPEQLPGLGRHDSIALSVISMLGMFISLILHELSHSLVARQFGLNVGGITLFLFGGVAELEHEPESPKSEFWIAIAGPAMSFGLAGSAYVAVYFFNTVASSKPLLAVVGYLGLINLVLAIFNLVPAFPLDGGRVLRAVVWQSTGDLLKATRIASTSGTIFALLLIGVGVLSLFSNAGVGGFWQILIGFFILTASRGSYEQLRIRQALGGRTVADLMTREPVTAQADQTILDLVENLMLKRNVSFVPVMEGDHLLGYVDTRISHEIDRENWSTTHVSDVYVALDATNSVASDQSLDALFDMMARNGQRKFLIANGGRLSGVITLTDMLAYLAIMQGLGIDKNPSARPERAVRQ